MTYELLVKVKSMLEVLNPVDRYDCLIKLLSYFIIVDSLNEECIEELISAIRNSTLKSKNFFDSIKGKDPLEQITILLIEKEKLKNERQ